MTETPSERVHCQSRDGLNLVGEAYGPPDGPPVLFMHGGGQTRHSWGGAARRMARRGWRTLTVDHRGHGDSDWSPEHCYSNQDFAGDVRQWIEFMGGEPILIGASLGGLAMMMAAGAKPKLKAGVLVLVDVTPRMEKRGAVRIITFMKKHMQDGFASLEEAAAEVAAYTPERRRAVDLESIRKNLRRRDGRWRWHWDPEFINNLPEPPMTDTEDIRSAGIRDADFPVLLIRGLFSDLVSPESVAHFKQLRPDAALIDVDGAGHMVAGDRNDVFTEAIIGFLERRKQ